MRKIILTYLFIIISYSLIFISLFHLPFEKYQPVLFYRGLILLIITTSIFLIVVIAKNFKKFASKESLIAAVFISFALNLSFFVVLPVTFDRSVTMFLLNTIKKDQSNAQCKGLSQMELEKKLIDEYIIKNKALEKRILEQKEIDFIEKNSECVELTPKALKFLGFSEFINRVYSFR